MCDLCYFVLRVAVLVGFVLECGPFLKPLK